MKQIQKLILPALFILIIVVIYLVYFAPKDELGSFTDFDPNNSAVKEIRVLMIPEKGITNDSHGGASFFVKDRNDIEMQVNADKVPAGIETAGKIILKGHLSGGNAFHAHDVELD